MILSRPSRLNCGSHFFTTSADLLLSSSMTSRVTYVPFFSDHHSVSIILCSPLDHEPWRDRTEYLIPISLAICSVLGTWQMLKKCGQMNDDTWMNEQMHVQSQIWCICHLLAQWTWVSLFIILGAHEPPKVECKMVCLLMCVFLGRGSMSFNGWLKGLCLRKE